MYKTIYRHLAAAALLIAALTSPVTAGTAEDDYAVAADHYAHHRWQLAAVEFAGFVEQHPEHEFATSAMFFLGESLVQQGKYAEGRRWFLKLIEQEPKHRFARQAVFRVGESSYLLGNHDNAKRELDWFCEQYPDDQLNAFALPYLGAIALAAAENDAALAHYESAIALFPKSPMIDECRYGRARALEQQGQWKAAQQQYLELAGSAGPLADDAQIQLGIVQYNRGQFEKAEQELQTFLRKFGDSNLRLHGQYWLGMSQVAQQKWQAAAATLTAAAAESPDHRLVPSMLFWAGHASRQNGDLLAAAKSFSQVVDHWPDSDWADDSLQASIQIAFDKGDLETAESLADQFVREFPNSSFRPFIEQMLGRVYLKQQDYQAAVEIFRRLTGDVPSGSVVGVSDLPESPQSTAAAVLQRNHYYLSLALLGAKQYEDCLTTLEKVRPSLAQRELSEGVYVARSMALMGLARYAEAMDPLQKYLLSQPDGAESAKCRIQLLLALSHLGRLGEASQLHNTLGPREKAHPLYGNATHVLANGLYRQANFQRAAELFALMIEHAGTPGELAHGISGLAWCQSRLGKHDVAAELFGRILDQHAASEHAPEAAFMRGKSLEQLGRQAAAAEAYQLVAANHPESKFAAAALADAARIQESVGNKSAAITLLERVLDEYPEFPQSDAAVYQLAWLLVETGRDGDADELFERLSAAPKRGQFWADATYRLAERAAAAGDAQRANELTSQLIAANCDRSIHEHALYLKGQIAADSKNWQETKRWMKRLVDAFPDSQLRLAADYWVAEAAFQRDEFEESGEQFQRLNEKITAGQEPWQAMIPLRLAQIRMRQERWAEAEEVAATIEQHYPQFEKQFEADYVLGRCLAMKAQFQDARQRYQRVTDSPQGGNSETAAMAQWMIGESYFHQKDYNEAIRAYHRVIALYPYRQWQAAALLQAGKCHAMQGEVRQAAGLLGQLIKDYPESPYVNEAKRRLQQLDEAAIEAVRRPSTPTQR